MKPNIAANPIREIIEARASEKNIDILEATEQLVSESLASLVAQGLVDYDFETQLYSARGVK